MANPTTNFGWVMPTNTDLVTDLPADFAVFGQGVDTSLADLLGGTTGQVLSKTSATDMDFTWINNDVGDITAVTAGTGISGGGTSGAVTVTNSMATAFTTSGDLIQATGSGTFARLATGTSGQYLTTNGTTNSWATLAGSPIKQIVYAQDNTNTTVASTTYADTGLTATITPTSASSKILVFFNHPQVYGIQGTNSADMNWQIMRGATSIATVLRYSFIQSTPADTTERISSFSYFWQDSPSTTSATTYKTQFARGASNVAMSWNVNLSSYSTMILVEI